MEADEPRKKKTAVVIGENLDTVGLVELAERITALEDEIRRVKSEIDKKHASKAAADSFFKS